MSNNTNVTVDTEVLEYILSKLVNHPEDVKIERKIDERGVLIMVTVNPKDMPIVIGREGRMVDSIRYVIKGVGLANNMNVRVYFLEPDGSFKYSDKISNLTDLTVIQSKKTKESDLNELRLN
jgi:uncharacterized protein